MLGFDRAGIALGRIATEDGSHTLYIRNQVHVLDANEIAHCGERYWLAR